MNRFLNKLITLCEAVIGAGLFIAGLSGFLSMFILNALLCVMGFFVFIDALSKVDNPEDRDNNKQNNEEK